MSANSLPNGRVYLVGAGPGDPGLLTVRGLELLRRAEVVVYDHLVSREILDLAPPQARRVYVGKISGKHTCPQEEINTLLLDEARQGYQVVRLKGGDPFIFGRGGEECLFLYDHGIPFEVVPGVSAVSAVPAYAGIPLTSRDYSTAFVAVTGHEHNQKEKLQVDWATIARMDATLVVFMGILSIRSICDELRRHGRPPETPAAVIRWGTTTEQETITGTLSTIADQVEQSRLRPPGLIVIGEVVRLREKLNWFETAHRADRDGE
ncbi:MAG: uroporphyrinogen-III C-methyltransferase [bacterium]